MAKATIAPPSTFPVIKYPTTQAPMNLTLNAEHIFFPRLANKFHGGKMCETLDGFHHDYGGKLRSLGRISYVNVYGTFSAQKVSIDGKMYGPYKTFFPETMNHQAVIDNIWDALRTGKIDILNNGDLKIKGMSRSGIEIECFIAPQGQITTAYPVI